MSREAFEHWYADYTGDAHIRKYCDSTGRYQFKAMESAWQAWQAALQGREPVALEWNGEGLPPVGTECEVSMSAGMFGASEWVACTILAYDIGLAEIAVFKTKAGMYGGAKRGFFRPIKTEREKAIQAMNPIICSQGMFSADGDACKAISAALYDAGYRKVEK